ncbi:hypothetical protein ACFQS2_08280 [Brachybacterium sp. GCM10030267]|uniref:hypothetical protein n=1 Tax=Brachybacterium sp. GCM10030267 TaxID=3273381 RepID=UPI0036214C82
MRSGIRSLLKVEGTGRPPPRWARAAGWACLLLPLPSVLWRLAMLAGVDVGFADAELFRGQPGPTMYVLGLNAVELVVGGLCLGLIMPWGERLPRRVPGLGGRAIPRTVPLAIGGAGNVAMYAIFGSLLASFVGSWTGATEAWTPDRGMDGAERAMLAVCYVPFMLWPVAITLALVGYGMRRRS